MERKLRTSNTRIAPEDLGLDAKMPLELSLVEFYEKIHGDAKLRGMFGFEVSRLLGIFPGRDSVFLQDTAAMIVALNPSIERLESDPLDKGGIAGERRSIVAEVLLGNPLMSSAQLAKVVAERLGVDAIPVSRIKADLLYLRRNGVEIPKRPPGAKKGK